MNRVTLINLAGRALYVEDDGVEAIDRWMEAARTSIASGFVDLALRPGSSAGVRSSYARATRAPTLSATMAVERNSRACSSGRRRNGLSRAWLEPSA